MKPLKPISTAKRSLRARMLIVLCIFVPMVLAMIATTSDKNLPAQNVMWNVRIQWPNSSVQSLLIIDQRNPHIRITGIKARDGNYVEVQMMLRTLMLSNVMFKSGSPDLSSLIVTTRSPNALEKSYSLVVTSVSQPRVDAKLGAELEQDPVRIIDIDKIPDDAETKIPFTPEEKKLPMPDDSKEPEPDGK